MSAGGLHACSWVAHEPDHGCIREGQRSCAAALACAGWGVSRSCPPAAPPISSELAAAIPALAPPPPLPQPTTSIQLRLMDGSRMVAKFNLTHTVADIRR